MKKPFIIISYLLLSSVVGIFVTLAIDYFENFAVEKKLRKDFELEIRNAADSFKGVARNSSPDDVLLFLKTFSGSALKGKLLAIDPANDIIPGHDSTFLFSYTEGNGRIDYYIKNSFLKDQLAFLDFPEFIFGVFTTFALFATIIIYTDKREKLRTLQQHLEVKHEEIRRVLEEHEALALLGRMSATLAHELKTPVATITNLIQILPARIDDKAFTERFVTIIKEELKRTQSLIENLLAYGKEVDTIQAEWIVLPPFLEELAVKNALRIETVVPCEVLGDRFYLGLMFDNLMRNSREAGAKGLRVTIDTDTKEDKDLIVILVEDDGKGFPTDVDLSSLLDPFVTGRSSGAGLGLYLAAKIAASHHAIISLYRPEQGAGVRISLPRKNVRTYENG